MNVYSSISGYAISNISFVIFVLHLLLIQCSDIEVNPGPDQSRFCNKNIQIANINVNSLRYKTDLLYSELGDSDVICVTETKLDNNIWSSDLLF